RDRRPVPNDALPISELTEWSALFASGARRRARAEAGIQGAATGRDADDLIRDVAVFLRLVERMLVLQPVLPQPRPDTGRPGAERDRKSTRLNSSHVK